MKKITQKLFFLILTVLSASAFAQITNNTGLLGADLIYHEDGRFATNAGYTITLESGTSPVSTNSTVPADDTEAGYTRPTDNYPNVSAASYTACVRIIGNNGGTANYSGINWIVINSVDLSAYDAGSKFFNIATLVKFFENGGTNVDDQNVFYYRNSDTGDDPTIGTAWTQIPSGLISAKSSGAASEFGADGAWTTTQIDLSSITCGTNFAIAIKRTTSADGPNPGETAISGTNRNGTMWISSQVYTGSTTPLSVSDNILSNAISVYPNPAKEKLNINKLDSSIAVKNTTLYSVIGKEIYRASNTNPIDVSNFSKGLYILKLESQEGGVLTKKVVVE